MKIPDNIVGQEGEGPGVEARPSATNEVTTQSTPQRGGEQADFFGPGQNLKDRMRAASKDDLETNFRRQLRFIGRAEGEWVEMRAIGVRAQPNGGRTTFDKKSAVVLTAYTDDDDVAVQLLKDADDSFDAVGLYVLPAAFDSAVLARGDRHCWRSGDTTKDDDVTMTRCAYWDFDAERPGGGKVSATVRELQTAMRRAGAAYHLLAQVLCDSWPVALIMSGNGAQVHVRADLPPGTDLVAKFVALGAALFDDNDVHVDPSMKNAARLVPACGSVKRKGSNAPDIPEPRVWRRTFIVCDDQVEPLSEVDFRELVNKLIERLTPEQRDKYEALIQGKKPAAIKGTPYSQADDAGHGAFETINAHPMQGVASALGLDPADPICPWCGKARDNPSQISFGYKDSNLFHCFHGSCGVTKNNVQLIAKTVTGDDAAIRGDAARAVLAWAADHIGVASRRRAVLTAADLEGADGIIVDDDAEDSTKQGEATSSDAGASDDDPRPRILIRADEHITVAEAVGALANCPDLYSRNGLLSRIRTGELGPHLEVLPTPALCTTLSSAARFYETKSVFGKRQQVRVQVPLRLAKAVEATAEWPQVEEVRGIVEHPVMRRDGSIIDTPGYDAATGLLYLPSGLEGVEHVAENPMLDEAKAAAELLFQVVEDFPFETPAHKAGWLAALLTPFARAAYDGPTPFTLVDGNTPGAGKNKLADSIGVITTGRQLVRQAHIRDDAEIEKRITSTAIAGRAVVLIDNIKGSFGGPVWDAVLTSTTWSGRRLGVSEDVVCLMLTIWLGTGNNVEPVGDTVRRILHIRLSSPEEDPEERTDFHHPDLLDWIRDNRARLIRAALIILRAYHLAGRPIQPGVRWGSFEGWAALVASAVVWLGYDDPCKTREGLSVGNNPKDKLAALLHAWDGAFGRKHKTVSEVLKAITPGRDDDLDRAHRTLREAVLAVAGGKDGKLPAASVLGRSLSSHRDRVAGGRAFRCSTDAHTKVNHWQVLDAEEAPEPVPPPEPEEDYADMLSSMLDEV